MNHTVDTCSLTNFEGGLQLLNGRCSRQRMQVAGINSDYSSREE